MDTSLSHEYQITKRQVGEANAEERLRLRTHQEAQEREDIRRQAEDAATQATRHAEDATRQEEEARRAAEIYEIGRQWRDVTDRSIGNVEASMRDLTTNVGDLTQRMDAAEDRIKAVEHQAGELGTQQREQHIGVTGRLTNVEGRTEGHETRLGDVERRTGTLEGQVVELGRQQRNTHNNVHGRVTNVEVTQGGFEDRMRGVEGRVGEVVNGQHQDHEEYTNLNNRVGNVEAANPNHDLAAVQEKQRDMEGQMGHLKGWLIGLTICAGVFGGFTLIGWIFGRKGKEKRDGSEGKGRRHAREWNWTDEDET